MKGDLILNVLEIIARAGVGIIGGTVDIMEAMMDAGYGASQAKLSRALRNIERRHANDELSAHQKRREYQRYATMLYKLQRDGLIAKKGKGSQTKISITLAGNKKLMVLLKKQKENASKNAYPPIVSQQFTIVAFDIPESDRKKRDWLRSVLKNLGLTMVQKSVWLGKIKIPEELIEDMKKMRIVDFVEIFEISKTGSLEHVI